MVGNPYKEQESEQQNKSRKSKTELKNLYMQQESRSTSRKYTGIRFALGYISQEKLSRGHQCLGENFSFPTANSYLLFH